MVPQVHRDAQARDGAVRTSRDAVQLEVYSNADFAADKVDQKALMGGVVLPNVMAMS